MYIELSSLCYGILMILGTAALIFLIICLYKLSKLLSKAHNFIDKNEGNLNDLLDTLPKASENVLELTDNIKTVSEVVTETAASAIETKEHFSEYKDIVVGIFSIIKKIFFK